MSVKNGRKLRKEISENEVVKKEIIQKTDKGGRFMEQSSYSAHISNKKSAITSKAKLAGVAKHNLRKYRSPDYSQEEVVLLYGTENLMKDVKRVYQEEFEEALKEYNAKQTREDRKIEDYFSHVSEKQQDMAVEIIFQVGDKEFWEKQKIPRNNVEYVYEDILDYLQQYLPNFVVANAVVHYDEASPHMHVVGVPVGRGFKRGLETKVSKRSVFTQETLSKVLQGELGEIAESCVMKYLNMEFKEKQKGRNYDLSVIEYKVKKETEKVEELDEVLKVQCKQNEELCENQIEIEQQNEDLYREQERLKEKKADLETDIFRNQLEQRYLEEKCEESKEKLGKLDKVLEGLKQVKSFIKSYLPFAPLLEEFSNKVESGEKELQEGCTITGYNSPLGELMESVKEKFQEHFYWFPRLMRCKTSKGDVAPVYRDVLHNGDYYEIKGYANVESRAAYRVEELQDEIKSENRVGTLEQIEQNIEAVEVQVRGMMEEEEWEREKIVENIK